MAHRILVPFELPDAEPLAPLLVEDLASIEVVALGHFNLPEQTPPDAAREQYGEAAQEELEALVRPLRDAGATVTTRIVFGKDRAKTIDRIALEEDCDAELDPAPAERIERILVPLVDAANLDRLADFVHALLEESTTEITLFHVVEPGEQLEKVEAMVRDARERMVDGGFEPAMVNVSVIEAEGHDEAILRKAEAYDAVVMDEASPNVGDRFFGTLADRIAKRVGDPVIVVHRAG